MKTCRQCGAERAASEFYAGRLVCKPCMKTYRQQHYVDNKPTYNTKNKAWHHAHREELSVKRAHEYKLNPEPAKARARKRAQEKPEQVRLEQRRKHLRTSYNLTLDEYDDMVAEQGGVCAICGGPPTVHGRFYVDHNHATGKVRALLCHGCNAALGMLRDDPALCDSAGAYLRKHGE